MMEAVNAGIVVLSVFSVIYFIFVYSSTTWERTSEGINLMLFPFSYLFLAMSSLSRRWDLLPALVEDALSVFAWLMVSFLMIQRGLHVRRAQRKQREWLEAEKQHRKTIREEDE